MRKIQEFANFESMLREGALSVPPLNIRVALSKRGDEDAIVDIAWRGQSFRYVAELKNDAKPQTLKLAIDKAKTYAQKSGKAAPMIIAPYLSTEKLDQLLNEGVSGLDFCGNGAVMAPGRFLFYKTGNPNRFPDSSPVRSAYRGDASLVARVLLLQPQFQAVSDILAAIKNRGGSLTMGTISKMLKRLESDLVIERPNRNAVRLLQPEQLLDGLIEAFQPPKIQSTWTGKVSLATSDLVSGLEQLSRKTEIIRTGESSAGEYAALAAEPILVCYCQAAPAKLLSQLKADAKETLAFANLRLIQTEDQRVYFDRRARLIASPIQSWLEMSSGEKRQKEAAEQIKDLLLRSAGITT